MNDHYSVRRLDGDLIARAYPLLQASRIPLTFGEWQYLAQNFGNENENNIEGMRAIVTEAGYVHGLFSCRTMDDIACGRVLMVDFVLLLDLVETRLTRTVLAATEALASEAGCAAVHVTLAEWRARALLREGYRAEALRLCKRLGSAPSESPR